MRMCISEFRSTRVDTTRSDVVHLRLVVVVDVVRAAQKFVSE